MVEAWGDNVPDGKLTDFKGAVKAKPDEVVVFSWFEYPDKAARDAANEKMMSDPRMKQMGANMPFDGQRMIFGGFAPIVEEGAGGKMGYADGFVVPVPAANKDAYRAMAAEAAAHLQGIRRDARGGGWGDDVPDGKVTDFKGAVKAERARTSSSPGSNGRRRRCATRPAEDHGRRAACSRLANDAVRRQAHDLRRLRADRRRLSKPPLSLRARHISAVIPRPGLAASRRPE